MIRNLVIVISLVFGFSTGGIAAEQAEKSGMAKTKVEKKETKTQTDQKAEADEALKKVEAMTDKARGKKEHIKKNAEKK